MSLELIYHHLRRLCPSGEQETWEQWYYNVGKLMTLEEAKTAARAYADGHDRSFPSSYRLALALGGRYDGRYARICERIAESICMHLRIGEPLSVDALSCIREIDNWSPSLIAPLALVPESSRLHVDVLAAICACTAIRSARRREEQSKQAPQLEVHQARTAEQQRTDATAKIPPRINRFCPAVATVDPSTGRITVLN